MQTVPGGQNHREQADRCLDLTEVWGSTEDLDAVTRDVFSQAMARAGMPMDGPWVEPVEFTPAVVMTPRAFASDASSRQGLSPARPAGTAPARCAARLAGA